MFADEAQRQIGALGASSARITLISVCTSILPASDLEVAVRNAALPHDMVGQLGDGSVGLLSLWSTGPDSGTGVEHRFLPRMKAVLAPVARVCDVGTVRFRAVHRWASELTDAADLFDSLFNAPPVELSIPEDHPQPRFVFPRPFASWRTSP
jgi:hypothetical protein